MKTSVTGVILAGGQNTRFSGMNKALIRVGGKCILERIYDVFSDLFEEIILVTNDPLQYLEWDLDIVTDLFPIRSSLTEVGGDGPRRTAVVIDDQAASELSEPGLECRGIAKT